MPKTILLVNGTFAKRIVLDVAEDAGERQVIVTSCTGEVVRKGSLRLGPGLHAIELPPAGVAEFVG
jgi:alpha-galactosidase